MNNALQKRLEATLAELEKIRRKIEKENPDVIVSWYLDGNENLYLMRESEWGKPSQENIYIQGKFIRASGGDW